MDAGYSNNDNILWCRVKTKGTDSDTLALDTGATVTAVIVDDAEANVETGLSLSYVSARTRYEVVPDEDQWTVGNYYTAVITVTGTLGEEGAIRVPFQAQRRVA